MHKFPIQPLQQFASERGPGAAIRRPKEVAFFSYDEKHHFYQDERSLRYYYPPTIGTDLSRGFETFQRADDTKDEHLVSLLRTIIDFEKKTGTRCSADIVTWRGMMTKIMASPYEATNSFEMNATKFQVRRLPVTKTGLQKELTRDCFIEENHEHKIESRKAQKSQPSRPGAPSQDMMSYWGYKFETLSLLPTPWHSTSREDIEGREEMVVNNNAQYCSLVKTGIGKSKLVIAGEVDALWDCRPTNKDLPINWVELKTSADIRTAQDDHRFQRKLLKFWIQSFLLGVPKIIVGFRSPSGILLRLEEFQTQDIPGLVKRMSGAWDGNLCINFAAAFLEWLKRTVTTDGLWRIRRAEKSSVIEVFRSEDSGHGSILSDDFLKWRTTPFADT